MTASRPTPTQSHRSTRDQTAADEASLVVLIAEDDRPLRDAMMHLVRGLGFTAIGVGSGDELLSWVEPLLLLEDDGCSPDVILTDIRMPSIEPLSIVEGLAKVGREVPVIVVSGVTDQAVRARVEELGYRWLQKPFSPMLLERALRDELIALFLSRSSRTTRQR